MALVTNIHIHIYVDIYICNSRSIKGMTQNEGLLKQIGKKKKK